MLVLLAASICCWQSSLTRLHSIGGERRLASEFEDLFWSGGSLDELYDDTGVDPQDAMSRVFVAAMREWREQHRAVWRMPARSDLRASLVSRIDRSMNFTITRGDGAARSAG